MTSCWSLDSHKRPKFKELVSKFRNILERNSGYLELSQSLTIYYNRSSLLSKEEREVGEEEMIAIQPSIIPGASPTTSIETPM